MSNNFLSETKGKAGQVGETVTWMVATVIIVVVLLISISATVVGVFDFKDFDYIPQTDVLASESFFSYLLTESDEGTRVYEQLGSKNNFSEFNGELAVNIFEEFYEEEYADVWIGFSFNRTFLPYPNNDYFGERPSERRGGDVWLGKRYVPHITEEVILDENKSIEMVLKVP